IQVDVVHLHGLDFDRYLPDQPCLCLATLHLPPDWYSPEIFRLSRPHTLLNCVSKNQRERCPDSSLPIQTIPPGIDVDYFSFASIHKRGYAVALGRICPEKGFHTAIEAAALADVPLLMAGQVFAYEAHQRYYEQQIAPRLNRRARFIGPVGLRKKRRLLAGARCVLIPGTAPETSSLVAMESLACGTPVIAFPSGALPSIVEHGRTGFLVKDETEMAAAIHRAAEIDPAACRRAARERFRSDRMVEDYLRVYSNVLRAHRGFFRASCGS
ncbi:MAG: glycosyltransferase, partial [Bryobacteraceae bacterium]